MGLDKQTIREVMQRVTQIPVERWQWSGYCRFRAVTSANAEVQLEWHRMLRHELRDTVFVPGVGYDYSVEVVPGYNYLTLTIDREEVIRQKGMGFVEKLLVYGFFMKGPLQQLFERLYRDLDVPRQQAELSKQGRAAKVLADKRGKEEAEEERTRQAAAAEAERRRLLDKF